MIQVIYELAMLHEVIAMVADEVARIDVEGVKSQLNR
jgi:hypothetical protein